MDERVRSQSLEGQRWPKNLQLRPEIANSWRRSILSGVKRDGFLPAVEQNVNRDSQLWRAAESVMDWRAEQLVDTPVSIFLADASGLMIARRTVDRRMRQMFDSVQMTPGIVLTESVAGTNATGTVLEDRRPVRISGAEHFIDNLRDVSCVGVPILHPITRKLRGVVSIACPNEIANSLLLPFASDMAREIEQRIYQESSRSERLLLEEFLSAEKRSARPIISLSDRIVISSPSATRILDDVGNAMLWESASRAVTGQEGGICELSLKSGEAVSAYCRPILDGTGVIGALVEIDVRPRLSPYARGGTQSITRHPAALTGLVGKAPSWREACEQAIAYRESRLPILLTGEPGTGKHALISALFADEHERGLFTDFDAAMQPIDGASAWISAVRTALGDPDRVVAIRHLEMLEEPAARALCHLVDSHENRAHLVATCAGGAQISITHQSVLDRFAIATIQVPALRHRFEDLPELLAVLSAKHATGGREIHWLPDSIQMLTRLPWSTNITQLENLVRRVLMTSRNDYITGNDLPDDVRVQASRRQLSFLERIELDAIMDSLRRTSGNKSEAAQALGISRATLYRRIRVFGIDLAKATF